MAAAWFNSRKDGPTWLTQRSAPALLGGGAKAQSNQEDQLVDYPAQVPNTGTRAVNPHLLRPCTGPGLIPERGSQSHDPGDGVTDISLPWDKGFCAQGWRGLLGLK
ncbi:unnamed protein product [Clonostachys chloroleuca]|uniref:Uncharacterized protein n=1 Tax=Clonostachys chloroleuca TaxID=1926264 RepID=A0AA35M982_9HYPO|nr:unnamed protein product [Clonostachys chloroleuca]